MYCYRSVHQPTRWTVVNDAYLSSVDLGGHSRLWWQIFKRLVMANHTVSLWHNIPPLIALLSEPVESFICVQVGWVLTRFRSLPEDRREAESSPVATETPPRTEVTVREELHVIGKETGDEMLEVEVDVWPKGRRPQMTERTGRPPDLSVVMSDRHSNLSWMNELHLIPKGKKVRACDVQTCSVFDYLQPEDFCTCKCFFLKLFPLFIH